MKIIIHISFFLLVICHLNSFSQSLSEDDLKQIAKEINAASKGVDFGNGVILKNCFVFKRTLIYQYDLNENWYPPQNMKEVLISNFKESGYAKVYFKNDVNVDFHYYSGNKLVKRISIKSKEFSDLDFELGDYLSIKDHPKSKGVNLKLKVPQGWEVKEGSRPNIVKKFTKDGSTYLILIKNNMTFFSRREIRDSLSDESFVIEFVEELSSFMKNPEVIDKSVVTIDTYPSVTFKVRGKMERLGITFPMIMRCWVVFYEDKIVSLQSMGIDNAEFRALEQLSFLVTNSVIFPDQYN